MGIDRALVTLRAVEEVALAKHSKRSPARDHVWAEREVPPGLWVPRLMCGCARAAAGIKKAERYCSIMYQPMGSDRHTLCGFVQGLTQLFAPRPRASPRPRPAPFPRPGDLPLPFPPLPAAELVPFPLPLPLPLPLPGCVPLPVAAAVCAAETRGSPRTPPMPPRKGRRTVAATCGAATLR